jgi:glucose-6-phosphate isomerase
MKLLFETSDAINSDAVRETTQTLVPYIESLNSFAEKNTYDEDEASLNLPFDSELLSQVESIINEKVSDRLKYIFVVGIGGSNLGTKAIYDALYGMRDVIESDRPKMIFVDTSNIAMLRTYVDQVVPSLESKDEYLLLTISKSGGTTETLANTEILQEALQQKFPDSLDRIVVITDEGSKYWEAAGAKKIARLGIPKNVGGRYSVLSAVGMLPLAALGLDIVSLQKGAQDIRSYCLNADVQHNPAAQSAAILANAMKSGKTINDNFVFNSELESLGKWYRQLMGESVGKELDRDGKEVHTGLTPTVSVGSTDLHSVGQLYLGGPQDKITTFIYSTDKSNSLNIPVERTFPSVVKMINSVSTTDIMDAILGGIKIAYNKKQLPFMEVQFEEITPYEIGAFMQFKMIEMMYLGKLLNVNPFDQPNVESYKIETKQLLETK